MADAQPTTTPPSDVNQTNQTNIQVNLDYLKTTRVHFCMPCYGGQLTEQTFMSFIKWANTARQLGLDWTVETMTNESLISRARNTLTAKFLATEGSTHLMFIDADIGWEPWHVLVLLNAQKDVIGGLYPMKSLPVKWCVNGLPGFVEEPGQPLIEVTKTGTGFLLMKREVFEKLNSHPAVRHFNNDIGLDASLNQYMKTYFDTAVRENRYYSQKTGLSVKTGVTLADKYGLTNVCCCAIPEPMCLMVPHKKNSTKTWPQCFLLWLLRPWPRCLA
jgi:hypothetical protein